MLDTASGLSPLARFRTWLSLETVRNLDSTQQVRGRAVWLPTGLICITIFGVAVGVRALHWQDSHVQITRSTTSLMGVFNRYRKETDRILAEGAIVFPRELPAPGDARMLAHPPGYSILMAGIKWASSRVYEGLWFVQIAADGLSAILIFLISSRLFRTRIGFIAAMMVAISPQLSYYCLLLTPDSLAVLPILASTYLLVLAVDRPRTSLLIVAGALIGLSCWLGANAMGLAFFLALLVPLLFSAGRRIRFSGALIAGAIVVIAPITVRNFIAYHRLIPISIQAGLSLAEGIGDFDPGGKLGMPRSDQEARVKDAEWAGRPDYGSSLWFPDGIERDHVRLSHAMTVVRDKPAWFLGVMLRRAAFMLRYNDSAVYGWPQDSSVVAFVEPEAPFSRQLIYEPRQGADPGTRKVLAYGGQILDEAATVPSDSTPAWSASPADLLASGRVMSAGARVTVEEDGQTLAITGDGSTYDNQFASALIRVEPNTDYILTTRVVPARATMALKVVSADMKKALASVSLADAVTAAETTKAGPRSLAGEDGSSGRPAELRDVEVQTPFATGSRTELYLAVSNNGQALGPPSVHIHEARLVAMGPTRGRATRIPRLVLRSLQKTLFTTSHTLALLLLGFLLCGLACQYRSAVIITAVPIYYLAAQSVLHTEYRYVLGIHYFAFIAAAIALSCGLSCCTEAVKRLVPARRSDDRALQHSMHPERVKD